MKAVFNFAAVALLIACSKGSESNGDATVNTGAVASASAPRVVGKTAPMSLQRIAGGVSGVAEQQTDMAPSAPDASSPLDAKGNALQQTGTTVAPGSSTATQIAPAMVIRNGQASVEVDKLDPAIVKLRQLATQLGGYVANSSIVGGHDQIRSATLELKIPAERFDQAVNGLGTLGKVESVNATAEDVGEEFVDVTARVNNAHRLEDRLIALLATRTGRLQDVLAVERELSRVREEIERYEGRLRYLKTRVAISTLSVTIHEPTPILGQSPGENPIAAALRQAWRNFVGFTAAAIAALGVLIPLGALAIVAWVVYRRIKARKS
jgi:hypothetical protein